MARVPWVERAFGQDRLARWHRLVGFTSFNLMLAHIVLITARLRAPRTTGVLAQAWRPGRRLPGHAAGDRRHGRLVMVVVTSVRAARRRLRYESWHLLHLYAYLGVGLALPHQLWTGTDFLSSPAAARVLVDAVRRGAGAVLVFRLGLPVWRTLRHRLVVVAVVVEEAPASSRCTCSGRGAATGCRCGPGSSSSGGSWTAAAGRRGQPVLAVRRRRRPVLRITVKDLGDGSRRGWPTLRPGTRVLVEGPYGAADRGRRDGGARVTLLASGIGITPLRALLEELPYGRGETVRLPGPPATTPRPARRDGRAGRRPRAAGSLPARAARTGAGSLAAGRLARTSATSPRCGTWCRTSPTHDVYVCGPEAWIDAVLGAAPAAGVPPTPGPPRALQLLTDPTRKERMRRIVLWPAGTVWRRSCCCSATTRRWAPPRPASRRPARSATPRVLTGAGPTVGTRHAEPRPSSGQRTTRRRRTTPATRRQWGPVQVQITVEGGRLTDVDRRAGTRTATAGTRRSTPTRCRSCARGASTAQSADIDMVSGATVTSEGYIASLQSALDQANL